MSFPPSSPFPFRLQARLALAGAVLACVVFALAASNRPSDNPDGYFRHGEMSMDKGNFDQAYADFRKALDLRPKNIDYELACEHAQIAAANDHIQKGEKYKAAKQYPEAAAEMQRAAQIDPSNFMAAQELEAITNLMHPPKPLPGEVVDGVVASSLKERLARAAGPTDLGPVAGTLVKDFTVNSDPKSAYLSVAKLAGLNVIFDSSSQGGYSNSGHVNLDLHNISLLQILRVLDVETDSFYTPITPNTILVANDNLQKHQAVDQTVLKVFYVKNVQAPTDLTELAQAIRGLMQPQPHLMPVASINALVMRDTPDKVAMVQKLLDDLDKAPPEVMVDVRILQVNRDLAKTLGLLPPTSFGIGLQAPVINTAATTTEEEEGETGTTTSSPTLNELTNLNSSNFAVTIPNATLNALLSDSNTHTVQEPQLRTIQGQKASIAIGQKIPIATGSFGSSVGAVGLNPLVNTQFTFQPVGVTLEITPEIQGSASVLLKDHIEISEVDSYSDLGGIEEPVIGNRVVDHTIDLKNGESAVLGGMIETTITHNVQGFPILADIPLLKYLFSSVDDETDTTEILIVMTPHIVRSLNETAEDDRALDTGTQDDVRLHELPAATVAAAVADAPAAAEPAVEKSARGPAPAADGAAPGAAHTGAAQPGMARPVETRSIPAPATPAARNTPNAAATNAAAAGPDATVLGLDPVQVTAVHGNVFGVKLALHNAHNAYALTFQLNYDPKLVQVQSMNLGSFLSQDGQAPALVHREDAAAGTAQVSLSRPPNVAGISGNGEVATITFLAKAPGVTSITITRLGARGPDGAMTPMQTSSATVTVH